jgi:hypothetical protein
MSDRESEYERLRRRIERLRRRIDRQAARLTDRTAGWIGYRSYVTRYPARSLLAAAGVGFVLSLVVSRVRWPRRFGVRLYDSACRGSWARIWALLRKVSFRLEDDAEPAGTGGTDDE